MGHDSTQLKIIASSMFDEYLGWLNNYGQEMYLRRLSLEYAFNLADSERYPEGFTAGEARELAKMVWGCNELHNQYLLRVSIKAEFYADNEELKTSLVISPDRR